MHSEPTTVQKMRRLPWMYLFNGLNVVFCQLTVFGSVFLLFLDTLGLDKKQAGVLLSLFHFACVPAVLIGPLAARFGVKRTFIIFYMARKFIVGGLLLTPLMLGWFGEGATFLYVSVIILGFAIARAIGETGFQAWYVELVPNSVRGKYSAVVNLVSTLTAVATMLFASYMLTDAQSVTPFLWLIGIGVVFGIVSVVSAFMLPGGAPMTLAPESAGVRGMFQPLRDGQFRLFLAGMGLWALAQPLVIFIPLYMKDRIGLGPGRVVLLDVAAQLAMVLVALPWGWAADRYGSKPVSLTGLCLLLVYPVLLLLIPRDSAMWSLPLAAAAVFFFSVTNLGWSIGINRLYFNNLVPREHRTAYTALHYAFLGLCGGVSPLVGGWVLDLFQETPRYLLGMRVDGYVVLMVMFVVCIAGAALLISRIRPPAGEMPTLSFAGMFFRGDPIGALGALISYNNVGREQRRLSTTERLGQARSPLNVNELIECLADPSFNVRYEAIISIARTRPNPKLTEALIDVLNASEPDLAIGAAWALGRIGDPRAIPPLREKLTAGYPLLAARCARALAMLGDRDSVPFLLARLRDEVDDGLRTAYASALGAIGSPVALPELLGLLRDAPSNPARFELALAITRIVGDEHEMVRLWRHLRVDRETALAQAVNTVRRQVARLYRDEPALVELAGRCSTAFDINDLDEGVKLLVELNARLPLHTFAEPVRTVLVEVQERLAEFGPQRSEYLLLAIDTLDQALSRLLGTRTWTLSGLTGDAPTPVTPPPP